MKVIVLGLFGFPNMVTDLFFYGLWTKCQEYEMYVTSRVLTIKAL